MLYQGRRIHKLLPEEREAIEEFHRGCTILKAWQYQEEKSLSYNTEKIRTEGDTRPFPASLFTSMMSEPRRRGEMSTEIFRHSSASYPFVKPQEMTRISSKDYCLSRSLHEARRFFEDKCFGTNPFQENQQVLTSSQCHVQWKYQMGDMFARKRYFNPNIYRQTRHHRTTSLTSSRSYYTPFAGHGSTMPYSMFKEQEEPLDLSCKSRKVQDAPLDLSMKKSPVDRSRSLDTAPKPTQLLDGDRDAPKMGPSNRDLPGKAGWRVEGSADAGDSSSMSDQVEDKASPQSFKTDQTDKNEEAGSVISIEGKSGHERGEDKSASEGKISCTNCYKSFSSKKTLQIHQKRKICKKHLLCHICDEEFTQKRALAKHLLTHSKQEQHICKTCGKAFASELQLSEHMVKHTEQEVHSCTVCDKKFARKEHLSQHFLTHSGQNVSSCTVCSEPSRQSENGSADLSVPRSSPLHSCNVCQKTFTRQASLSGHMLLHSE